MTTQWAPALVQLGYGSWSVLANLVYRHMHTAQALQRKLIFESPTVLISDRTNPNALSVVNKSYGQDL